MLPSEIYEWGFSNIAFIMFLLRSNNLECEGVAPLWVTWPKWIKNSHFRKIVLLFLDLIWIIFVPWKLQIKPSSRSLFAYFLFWNPRELCLIPTSISIHFHWIRKVIIMRIKKIYRKYCIVEHQIFRLFVLRYFLCCIQQVSWKPWETKVKSV